MQKSNTIVHVHIFKNAGSTFDDTLKINFGDRFVDHREDDLIRSSSLYLTQFLDKNPQTTAFSSHSIYHFPKSTSVHSLHPVYILRHPIERIRSVYAFELKQPESASRGAKMAKELCFEDYVAWRMKKSSPATIRNLQMIFLAGIGSAEKLTLPDDQIFELANRNLDAISLLGIVDRYDDSMVVFEEYLKQYYPEIDLSYIRKNVTDRDFTTPIEEKAISTLNRLKQELADIVVKSNEYDQRLYRRANEILNTKLKQIKDYNKKIINFKIRCLRKVIKQELRSATPENAIDIVESAIVTIGDTAALQLLKGEVFLSLKQYDAATSTFLTVQQREPDNIWAHLYTAEIKYKCGETNFANNKFDELALNFPEHTSTIAKFKNRCIHGKSD